MNQQSSFASTSRAAKKICLRLHENRNEIGDVKFIVDSEEIWAHRCVLASLSPKFKAQFYGSMPDTGNIKVDDVSAASFNEFLKYFYANKVQLTSDNIEDVFSLAKQSLVKDLVQKCEQFLLDSVELDTIVLYLRLAQVHNLKELHEKCDDFINANIKKIFKSADFLNYDRDMLIYVLSSDTLDYNQTEVFKACMKWAREECKRNGIHNAKAENVRTALGDAFYRIRFGLMTFTEFVDICQFYPDLFTSNESTEVFLTIGGVKDMKSRLFNGTLRKPRIGFICMIVDGPGEYFAPRVTSDMISFSCDKAINLNGFLMSAVDLPFDSISINIHDGTSSYKNYRKTIQKSNEEFKVIFDEPFKIKSNQKHSVWFDLSRQVPQLFGHFLLDGVHFKLLPRKERKVISQLFFDY